MVVFCSYRIDGGGNQSGKKIAEMLGCQFVNLHTEEWKSIRAEKQVWYMNDDIYRLNGKDKEAFYEVLKSAKDIKVVFNFVIGGLQDWMIRFPVSKVLFLNNVRIAEWDAMANGKPHAFIKREMLCPPINLEQFEIINRPESDKVRIGRHSRMSLKFTPDPEKLYEKLDNGQREFHFMVGHPKIKERFKDNDNFKFYEWNQVPVKDFLQNIDIWLAFINPNTREQGPRTVAEAMAAGCCVIAENRDGMKDRIINGETGFLVNNEQEAIEILNELTKEDIKIIGQQAREYAFKHFKPDNWVKTLNGD